MEKLDELVSLFRILTTHRADDTFNPGFFGHSRRGDKIGHPHALDILHDALQYHSFQKVSYVLRGDVHISATPCF